MVGACNGKLLSKGKNQPTEKHNIGHESQKHRSSEGSQIEMSISVQFHLYKVLKQAVKVRTEVSRGQPQGRLGRTDNHKGTRTFGSDDHAPSILTAVLVTFVKMYGTVLVQIKFQLKILLEDESGKCEAMPLCPHS